jgi:hypothetical protein
VILAIVGTMTLVGDFIGTHKGCLAHLSPACWSGIAAIATVSWHRSAEIRAAQAI